MKISFHGACQEVTGSCILIETDKTKFLVDCGMFQGEEEYKKNFEPFSFNPETIDFLLLTHAHIDHCGRLPYLVRQGFRGNIFCTPPTADLTELMLLDSAKIFLSEQNKTAQEPLYYDYDIEEVKKLFVPFSYEQEKVVCPGIKIIMRDAGHILGSAIFEVLVNDNGVNKKLVFSGDLGNSPSPLLRNTAFIKGSDFVFIESTYGGETHVPREQGRQELKNIIQEILFKKSNLIIPVFAMERVQELLYELKLIFEQNDFSEIPVFCDSPLAVKTTEIYQRYGQTYFNEFLRKKIKTGEDPFHFPGLKITANLKQSFRIDKVKPPKIILAGGGMISGGRIMTHLDKYITDPKNILLLVSYQAEGTYGREILDGAKKIKIDKKTIPVRSKIAGIFSFSSHADEPHLENWISQIKQPRPYQVFINHGEKENSLALSVALEENIGIKNIIPIFQKEYIF